MLLLCFRNGAVTSWRFPDELPPRQARGLRGFREHRAGHGAAVPGHADAAGGTLQEPALKKEALGVGVESP